MDGTDEMRQAAVMARDFREQVTATLRSGGGTAAQRHLLQRLDRGLAKAAKSLGQVADDFDLLERITEGNTP